MPIITRPPGIAPNECLLYGEPAERPLPSRGAAGCQWGMTQAKLVSAVLEAAEAPALWPMCQGMSPESRRRAMNTYSRLSSVSGSRAKPP